MTIVEEMGGPTSELEYERKHPLDPYLAGLLYVHYSEKFGKLPFAEWNKISTDSVNGQIVKNLNFLAYGGLEPCVKCSVCQILKDKGS